MVVFVTLALMYGTVMPAFYIIALAATVAKFVFDKVLLCHYFQKPPSFNADMIETFLSTLRVVPLITLPFVFW